MTKRIKNLTSTLRAEDSTMDTIPPSCHREAEQLKEQTTKHQHLLLGCVMHSSADRKQTEHSARQYRCRPLASFLYLYA